MSLKNMKVGSSFKTNAMAEQHYYRELVLMRNKLQALIKQSDGAGKYKSQAIKLLKNAYDSVDKTMKVIGGMSI